MLNQQKAKGRIGCGCAMMKSICSSGLAWLWISVLVLGLDRFSKFWVEANLVPHEPLIVLPVFDLTLAYNTGAAFSFLHSASGWQNLLFVVLACAVSLYLTVWLYRSPRQSRWMNIALSLVLGGALGNAWDRLSYGYVVDFFHFHINDWHFAIFNVADCAICIGAAMLILGWKQLPK